MTKPTTVVLSYAVVNTNCLLGPAHEYLSLLESFAKRASMPRSYAVYYEIDAQLITKQRYWSQDGEIGNTLTFERWPVGGRFVLG